MKTLITEWREILSESLENELFGKEYYHTILNRQNKNYIEMCRNVYHNGLICHDNGEIGSAIWFANGKGEYNQGGNGLEFSMTYDKENKDKFDLTADFGNMFAHSDIPFDALTLVCAPCMVYKNDLSEIVSVHGPKRLNNPFGRNSMVTVLFDHPQHYHITIFMDIVKRFCDQSVYDEIMQKIHTTRNDITLENLFV